MSSRKSLKMEIIKLCFVCHVVHKYNFIEIECFLYGCKLNYTRDSRTRLYTHLSYTTRAYAGNYDVKFYSYYIYKFIII